MAHNYTKYLESLHQAVQNMSNELDNRLGIAFKVRTQGKDVIITLNTTERDVVERRESIEDKLFKYSNDFIASVKKEYKKLTGKGISLKHKRQEMLFNAANYSGEYFVTILNVFDADLIKEEN